MHKKRILSLLLVLVSMMTLLSGCGKTDFGTVSDTDAKANSDHPTITMNAPYRNMSLFYDLVKEKYPEVNLEIIPYYGQNATAYMTNMRVSDQLPDIYFSSVYVPGRLNDKEQFLDMSSYDFTDRFVQSRLREVTLDGGVYMLPISYSALGITYNQTLLEKNGWSLPTNLSEMEVLKEKAEAAGYTFCVDMLALPGFGFQYLCNICDTGFLSSAKGIEWQNKFVSGEATVAGTPEMVENLQLLQRWRDIGILTAGATPNDDGATKQTVAEGKTLFVVGNSADFGAELGSDDQYRLMPYLSEDGNHNVFILNVSRFVGLNKALGEKGNEKKLADVMKVMDVLSTVEGLESLEPTQNTVRLFALKDATVSEDSFYADILDQLNSGHTASFIYGGWENAIVPIGEKMLEFVKGNAELDDVIKFMDESQKLITENKVEYFTTVTETIGLDDCAKAIGIAFAQATGSEAALISTNPWVYDPNSYGSNGHGVSGRLFPLPMDDQAIVSILPTGWHNNIETVTLTGARIKELASTGFDCNGNGVMYPYVLVTKGGKTLDDNTSYTIPICGLTDAVAEEGSLQDSGILGLDAAKNYFSQFETFATKDIQWE